MPENVSLKAAEELNFLKISCLICYEAQLAQDSLTVTLKILTQSNTQSLQKWEIKCSQKQATGWGVIKKVSVTKACGRNLPDHVS